MSGSAKAASIRSLRLQLTQVTGELTALVDEMEAEWQDKGMLSATSADRLHALRQRAELLLNAQSDDEFGRPGG